MISPFFHGAVPHLELEISTMDRRVDALRVHGLAGEPDPVHNLRHRR
jgi:hypothetical protein